MSELPEISIILSCYNGEQFLVQAIDSIVCQSFRDWEMIIVDDGSTDNSLAIANKYRLQDERIQVVSKPNSGLNSARNFGLQYISGQSVALIFSDADDILHPDMLRELYSVLQNETGAGATYCNYDLIDEHGDPIKKDNSGHRYVPTKFWVRALSRQDFDTPFYSLYTWAPIVEPMTLIRKDCFLTKWDEINFSKGNTFGESIPLFGEIALNSKIIYVDKILYHYRKHTSQITNNTFDIRKIQRKIDRILERKALKTPAHKPVIKNAMRFRKYRLPLYLFLKGDLKHELRYRPWFAILKVGELSVKYLYSLPLFLFNTK